MDQMFRALIAVPHSALAKQEAKWKKARKKLKENR